MALESTIDRLRTAAGVLVAVTAAGTVTLYAVGYLSLRFHLAALGVGLDLPMFDERYLFEGVRFAIHLLLSVSVLALTLLAGAGAFYLPYRLVPGRARARLYRALAERLDRLRTRWSTPGRLALLGTVLALAVIHLALRPCFVVQDLLLRPSLPGPLWLQGVLLDHSGLLLSLYSAGLLAAIAWSSRLLWLAWERPVQSFRSGLLLAFLACLVVVEIVLLPVSYGILTTGRDAARVARVDAKVELEGESPQQWLVWAGDESWVYLVRESQTTAGGPPMARGRRRLVVIPAGAAQRIEITCHEPLLAILYRGSASPCS